MADGKLIYLSLGSNLGDRAANLERAIEALPEIGVRVLRRSSIYETEPVDFLAQPWFLNCVVEAETSLAPRRLLEALQAIERNLGSKKLVLRGPRIIDLDILFYGAAVIQRSRNGDPAPAPGRAPLRARSPGRTRSRVSASSSAQDSRRVAGRHARS